MQPHLTKYLNYGLYYSILMHTIPWEPPLIIDHVHAIDTTAEQLVQKDTTEDHLTARQTLPNTSTLKSPQLIDCVHDHSTDQSLLPACWSSTSQPVQMNSVLSSIQKKIPSLIR